MTILRLIADDLTGALDSAAQFTGVAGPLPVLLEPPATHPAGSFALDLSCRDGAEAAAVDAVQASASCYRGADIAFKKIDSLLRGHWAAELTALARTRLFRRIILAPAFPAQRRVTRDGRQAILEASGDVTPIAIDPVAALSKRGVTVRRDGDRASVPDGETVVHLCDASTQADLDDIVRRESAGRDPVLWCGAAGLALALADRPPATVTPERLSHLVIIGSIHPVTRGQVEALTGAHPAWIGSFDADGRTSASRVMTTMERHGRCVVAADLPPGLAPVQAAQLFASWFADMVPHLARPEVLTVVGGETFAALCRSLGAHALAVEGECQPGIPASRMMSGQWSGVSCFSKSGAFGEPDWLCTHLGP
ncbi:four-carbon acid sugar kinase family protein [Chelatococcus sp. GCM10030263]|uniref:four-carbon acid sugar kinase family protein n=1 Tax=Chelatococcus sp. GCM10030263 TaxID=3273387 RepID=UPI00361AB4F7